MAGDDVVAHGPSMNVLWQHGISHQRCWCGRLWPCAESDTSSNARPDTADERGNWPDSDVPA